MLMSLLCYSAALSAAVIKETVGGFTYQADEASVASGATVITTSLTGAVSIPASVMLGGKTYTVTGIATNFIHYNYGPNYNTITSITLPPTIKSIATGAFGVSTSLQEIKIDGVSNHFTVEDGVLYNKDKSTLVYYPAQKHAGDYTVPSHVKNIGGDAFSNNTSLISVAIPNTLLSIGNGGGTAELGAYGTFYGCKNLTTVTYGEGVNHTAIPAFCFAGCSSLVNINIPSTVISINNYAFDGCSKLNISLPPQLESLGWRAFQSCSGLSEVIFPPTMKTLATEVFNNCKNVKKLIIPDECPLNYVSNSCFRYNTTLSEVYLSRNITEIRDFAFQYCYLLPTVNMPEKLKKIGKCAFQENKVLENLTFNSVLDEIDEGAFTDCVKLNQINLPASLKKIGHGAFFNTACETIVIPASLTSIGENAFGRTKNLKQITVEPGNTVYTTIDNVLFTTDKKTLMAYPAASDRTVAYTVPAGVETITVGAFTDANLTHITLPSTLKTIKNGAFAFNTKLTELTIPASVTSIGKVASTSGYSYTMSLNNIISGTQVSSLYLLNATTPPVLDTRNEEYVVPKTRYNTYPTVYVKKSAYDSNVYQNADRWNKMPSFAYEIPVTLPSSGIASIGRDFDVDLSASTAKAYIAKSVDLASGEFLIKMEEIPTTGMVAGKYVPSRTGHETINGVLYETYTGVLLRDENNLSITYRIGENEDATVDISTVNHLCAVTDATKIDKTLLRNGIKYTNFILKGGKFRYVSETGTIAYNKSYLSLAESLIGDFSGAKELPFMMIFDESIGQTTGINTLESSNPTTSDAYYTLQGVRVRNPKNGIYIHNNKKVIIK